MAVYVCREHDAACAEVPTGMRCPGCPEQVMQEPHKSAGDAGAATDPLDRCKQIRERVAELEAEVQRLVKEHEALTGGPWQKPDANDIAWATGKDGVNVPRAPQPTPYGLAGIEGDAIVIRLTADACAFAFANDPQAREPRPPVTDKQQFLRDTLNELTAEREDGSTPLTDMLDRAMVKAMENGSDALDHDATPGVPGTLNDQGEKR